MNAAGFCALQESGTEKFPGAREDVQPVGPC